MKIKQLRYLVRKDFIDLLRTGGLLVVIVVPLLLSFVFMYSMRNDELRAPKLVIYDLGSPDFVDLLKKQRVFRISEAVPASWEEARHMVLRGQANAAVQLPPSLKQAVKEGRTPEVLLVLDDSSPIEAALSREALERLLWVYSIETPPGHLAIVNLRGLSVQQSTLPIWIVMSILAILPVISIGVAEEKENKTINALLLAAVSRGAVVLSKIIVGVFLTLVLCTLLLIINEGFIGSIAGTYTILFLGAVALAELGLLLGFVAPNQTTAGTYNAIMYFPLILGAIFAKSTSAVKYFVQLLPSYYISTGLEKSILKGINGMFPWQEAGVLASLCLILFAVDVYVMNQFKEG